MSHICVRDVGGSLQDFEAGAGTATAAGTGDNTAVVSDALDILDIQSGKLIISYITTLTAAKTLSFTVAYELSDDNSSWDASVELYAKTAVETGELTAEQDTLAIDIDMSGWSRYVRFTITPDLSHSGTDTVSWGATLVGLKKVV